jgi:hypothetical protein
VDSHYQLISYRGGNSGRGGSGSAARAGYSAGASANIGGTNLPGARRAIGS